MPTGTIYISSDHDVTLTGASIAATGAYLNSATVTYSLADASGTVVGTGTLAYVAASNGNYAGTIESTVTANLVENTPYYLTVVFGQSTYQDLRKLQLWAAWRQYT